MMSTLLQQLGYTVKTAGAVASALELARAIRFDLYVIDNHFPDATGAEFCREIRTFDEPTPVIIYSGTSMDADFEEALRAGAEAYILKPYVDELLQKIKGFLNSSLN
jgi:two-component system, OmpR family, response regulator